MPGLYGAGQFCGTSGYEEAAVQGFVAGVNAARKIKGQHPVLFPRDSSYIGTLIDDIVTKGCLDPYRMMTSRSEYRLLLRQDNAEERMFDISREIGIISEERQKCFLRKQQQKKDEIRRLSETVIHPSDALSGLLVSRETTPPGGAVRVSELLKRPRVTYEDLAPFDPGRPPLPREITEQAEIEIKYEGYIKKQLQHVQQMKRLEELMLPEDTEYSKIEGLRLEAREKLGKIRPKSIGQATRISGVSPADISVLIIWTQQRRRSDNDR